VCRVSLSRILKGNGLTTLPKTTKDTTKEKKSEEMLPKKRGRPPKPKAAVSSTENPDKDKALADPESALKDVWEAAGQQQATQMELNQAATLPPEISVACGVSLFLRTLKGQSAQTHKTYRVGCRVFMYFLYESGRGSPAELKVVDLPPLILEDYYLWLVDKYSRGKRMTVSGYMAGPRNLFSYLARRDVTPGNVQYSKMVGGLSKLVGRGSYKTPRVDFSETRKLAEYMYRLQPPPLPGSTAIPPRKVSPDLANLYVAKRTLSQKEIEHRRLEVLRDRAIILTLYTTGMRREEVSRLNRADVRDGKLEEAIITGKGDKERVVFFDEPTLEAIREYLTARNDSYQPLFIRHQISRGQPKAGGTNFRLSPFGVWAVVQKWAKKVKVEVNPHDFRHGLATTMLNSGAQLSEVQDVLGHASPVTTKMIYAHYERKTLRAAVNKHRVSVGTPAENTE
jgi:site-specific recombinase XerD